MERQNLTFRQMAWNALATYGFCFLWVITIQLGLFFLGALLGADAGKGVIELVMPASQSQPSTFQALIWAPFFEELLYRVLPLSLAAAWDKGDGRLIRFTMIAFCGVLFGLGHGSVVSILFQGVLGYMLARLFVKNYTSMVGAYLSCVFVHFAYNYTLTFLYVMAS